MVGVRGAHDFNEKIRSSLYSAQRDFDSTSRKEDDDIRLHWIGPWEKDIEWSSEYSAAERQNDGSKG